MGEANGGAKRVRELLSPRVVAVVGANDGNGFVRNLAKSTSGTPFQLVNRRGAPVLGHTTLTSIAELETGVDLLVLSVPADGVLPAVVEGVERGIRNFIVHSSGFGEAGAAGQARQADLVQFALENDVLFLGPNCLGFVNCVRGIPLHGAPLPDSLASGRVGLVAQSGSASIVIMNANRQFNFSHIVTTGNEALCRSEDVLQFLIEDDNTDVILMFLESLRDGRRFIELAREAMKRRKPIVALKVGRSAAGKRVAMSHTGAIAGAEDVYEAALRSVGVIQVFDFDQMIQTTNVLTALGSALMTRPAIVGISGGELGLVADIANDIGLHIPALSIKTQNQLAEILALDTPSKVLNPLDVGTGYSFKTFKATLEQTFKLIDQDDAVDGIVLVQDSQKSLHEGHANFYQTVTDVFANHVIRSARPALHVSNLSEAHDDFIVQPLRNAGVLSLAGIQTGLQALQKCAVYAGHRLSGMGNIGHSPGTDIRGELERFVTIRRGERSSTYVPEYEALSLLARLGLPSVQEVIAATSEEAVSAAEKMGYPVVIKIWSDEVVHKAAAGGVVLGVTSADQVVQAFSKVTCAVATSHGVIVAPQKSGTAELILGAIEDPTFGTFIIFGIGGGLVESLGRTNVFAPPRTFEEATEMIASSHAGPVLRQLGLEPQQFSDTVLRFATVAKASQGLFSELEINPMIVNRSGDRWAVDARMRLS